MKQWHIIQEEEKVKVDDKEVEWTREVKNLGVILYENLNFNEQVKDEAAVGLPLSAIECEEQWIIKKQG